MRASAIIFGAVTRSTVLLVSLLEFVLKGTAYARSRP